MKIKFKISVLIILSILFTSCSTTMVSYKNLKLNLNESTFAFCKDELDFEEDEILKLNNPTFGNDKYIIVVDKIHHLSSDQLYYYYLFKNDILYYYGYTFQFHMNENDIIRIAGEEATKYAIKKDEIELEY